MAQTDNKVTQWDPGEVIVTFDGTIIDDFAPDEFINHARNNPTFSTTKGLTGSSIVARNYDRSGTLTLTLRRSSPSNKLLNDLFKSALDGDLWVFDCQIKDLRGSGLLSSRATIDQPPDWVGNAEGADFAWTITLLNADVEISPLNQV